MPWEGDIEVNKVRDWLNKHENRPVDGKKFVKQYNAKRKANDWALKKL